MTTLIIFAALIILGTLLALSYRRIPEGQVYTLRRSNSEQPHLLPAGRHWIVPLRDHIVHKISLTGRTLKLDAQWDDSPTRVQGTVYWQVLDPVRADAMIEQADAWIRRETLNNLRTQAADLAGHGAQVKDQLNSTLRPQGILVTRLDLRAAA